MSSSLRRRKTGKKRRDSLDGRTSPSASARRRSDDAGVRDDARAGVIQPEVVAPARREQLAVEPLADDDPRALALDDIDFDDFDAPAAAAGDQAVAGRRGVVQELADDDPLARALDDIDLDDFDVPVPLTPAQRRNQERLVRRMEPSAEHLRLIALQEAETARKEAEKRAEQIAKVRDLLRRTRSPLDPKTIPTIDLGDILAVGRIEPLLGVTQAELELIERHIRDGIREANTHFLRSRPYGFLATILDRNRIDLSAFALQNSPAARRAYDEYIATAGSPQRGVLMFKLARVLIAQNIVQSGGFNDRMFAVEDDEREAIERIPVPPEIEALRGIAADTFSDAELNEFEDVFGMTAQEMEAIEIYTHPSTNARMEASFGSAAAGWVILTRAINKLPSTGELGIEHAGFRVSRYGERTSLDRVPPGTQIIHGNRIMAQGQRHFMSTSSAYNVHNNTRQVAEAGGFFAIRGTSGRFINLFGVFGNLDGAEVLYPPGTLTTYIGIANGRATIPVMELTEADPRGRLNPQVLDDFDYTLVDNPILEQQQIREAFAAAATPAGLRRRRVRVSDEV